MGNLLSKRDVNGAPNAAKVSNVPETSAPPSGRVPTRDQAKLFQKYITEILAKDRKITQLRITNDVDDRLFDAFEYITEVIDKTPNKKQAPGALHEEFLGPDSCAKVKKEFTKFVRKDGKLKARKKYELIMECGEENCMDRIQKPELQLELFMTADGRGWGLKTLVKVSQGSFVFEYTGELDRTENINEAHTSKSYDLSFADEDSPYTIDGYKKSNLSRFLNHSCDPNLRVWHAASPKDDKQKHRLYFFADKAILANEELTLDYFGGVTKKEAEKQVPANVEERVKCLCKAKKCRGFTI